MYRIFGRQQFNYSTKKSAYITYQFPKWQCVKVKYTEESVPNRKYFLRTNTTIQQVKKRSHLENFTPKLSEIETSILLKAYISLKYGYEEKCTEVFKICNSTIQPQKAHIWYPQTKLWWYNQRTAYTIKKNYDTRIYVQNFWEAAIQLFNQKKRVYNISLP